MVMHDKKSTTEKNAPPSQAISIAMTMCRCDAKHINRCSLSRALRSHWTPPLGKYSPHIAMADAKVINFWPKKSVKSLSEASIQKAPNGPSAQLIEETSCVERSNATIKTEELS